MCIGSKIKEIIAENETIQLESEERTDWPSNCNNNNEILFGCGNCYFPIVKVLDTNEVLIENENGLTSVSAICKTKFLFTVTENYQPSTNIEHCWKNEIYCFHCEKLLSYSQQNVPIHITQYRADNKTAILNIENLVTMRAEELKAFYENNNN